MCTDYDAVALGKKLHVKTSWIYEVRIDDAELAMPCRRSRAVRADHHGSHVIRMRLGVMWRSRPRQRFRPGDVPWPRRPVFVGESIAETGVNNVAMGLDRSRPSKDNKEAEHRSRCAMRRIIRDLQGRAKSDELT